MKLETQLSELFKRIELKSYHVTAIQSFLALEPMNKSRCTEVIRMVNSLVDRASGTNNPVNDIMKDLRQQFVATGGSSDFEMYQKFGTKNKKGINFLEELEYSAKRALKLFKIEELSETEQKIYRLTEEYVSLKDQVKKHADELKALIITKENKVKIPAIKKVYPTGIPKDSLEEILFAQTTILKDEYLTQTEIYAKISFENAQKISKMTQKELEEKWPNKFKLNYGSSSISIEGRNKYQKAHDIVAKGFDKFVDEQLYMAEIHYYDGIKRLASRLTSKGIIQAKDFKIQTAKVKQNIETTIEHADGKITKAWTIVASGLIQQPHFRYLVR